MNDVGQTSSSRAAAATTTATTATGTTPTPTPGPVHSQDQQQLHTHPEQSHHTQQSQPPSRPKSQIQSQQPLPQAQPQPQPAPRRPARSKDGCLTCRRRKVRCNEQRPRCSHCERLNLECKWRPPNTAGVGSQQKRQSVTLSASLSAASAEAAALQRSAAALQSPMSIASNLSNGLAPQTPAPYAVDQFFDYASFMWDSTDLWQQRLNPDECAPFGVGIPPQAMDAAITTAAQTVSSASTVLSNGVRDLAVADGMLPDSTIDSSPMQVMAGDGNPSTAQHPSTAEDHLLIDFFVRSAVPPILAQVETQQKWSTMRQILISMSNTSSMLRCAILAFSDLLLRRKEGPWLQSTQAHYERAVAELNSSGDITALTSHSPRRENLLATLFFLSYVDILEGRMQPAHTNLKGAYAIFRQGEKNGFRSVEIRLLSWIRLLDARAVSAGGEGLFLSDDDESLLVQPSPASLEGGENDGRAEEIPEGDIEDVLFQVLYHPGIVFYQKVQSFMGRISKIDPWHRSRGTVEDETEVMNIAAGISKDLRALYDSRPPLMDYAVAGKLTSAHVSANLAFTITRAFRTYLSNYHASKVHLHRVAYKALPMTRETTEALHMIRQLARLMVQGPEEEPLPVNMLWPLLMLGVEEHDPDEREWIKTQILRMEKVATNARITAQVLEEVQARQDAAKTRMDIRSIMHAIFDQCFAIV